MLGFNSKNKNLENLLRQSRQDFGFDSENVKARLMMAVNVRHLTKEDIRQLTFNPKTWPKFALGTSLGVIMVLGTTGLAFASTKSKPGEILFPVQKLQNQLVLSLPLPAATKAEISTNIVAKRLRELDELQKSSMSNQAELTAEIKEAQASMIQAVNLIPEGDEKSDEIFTKLDMLSIQHQKTLQSLSSQTDDDQLKSEIEQSVKNITETQDKLRKNHKTPVIPKDESSSNSGKNEKSLESKNKGKNSGSSKFKIPFRAD